MNHRHVNLFQSLQALLQDSEGKLTKTQKG